jgi:hypothetical protein
MVENKRRFRISERISVVEVLYLRSRTWRATVDGTHVENVPALHKWNETGVWPIRGIAWEDSYRRRLQSTTQHVLKLTIFCPVSQASWLVRSLYQVWFLDLFLGK